MRYYIRKRSDELYHYGTKGMKWGVRRYQNDDGSLTPAGKRRYENADGSLNEAGKEFYRQADAARRASRKASNPAKYTTLAKKEMMEDNVATKIRNEFDKNHPKPDPFKNGKDVIDAAANATNKLSNLEKQTRPKPVKVKMDLSNMSDQEMRNEINRALLERQYNDLFAPQKVNKGRERLGMALEIGGGVLAVVGSAVGIAASIKSLMD